MGSGRNLADTCASTSKDLALAQNAKAAASAYMDGKKIHARSAGAAVFACMEREEAYARIAEAAAFVSMKG
jgi:hypothetical protein